MKLYKSKEWLEQQFKEIGNNVQIGQLCGVSGDTIEYWRKKFNIPKSEQGKQVRRKRRLNQDFFNTIDTEEKAYWLGFAMADGCITRTEANGPYNRFCFCLKGDDISHLEKLNKSLDADYPIKTKTNINKKLDFETTICEIRISSRILCDNLIRNGVVPNKTGKEILPDTVPQELIKHFIRGFFDGDGCLAKTKKIDFSCSSKFIIDSIHDYFKKELDIDFHIYKSDDYSIPFYRMESNHYKNNKIVLDHLYKDATIYLDRKYNLYLDLYGSPIQ